MGQILSLTTFQDMPKHATAVEKRIFSLHPLPDPDTFIEQKLWFLHHQSWKRVWEFFRTRQNKFFTQLWWADFIMGCDLPRAQIKFTIWQDDYSIRGRLGELQFKYSGTRCTRSTQSFLCNCVFAKGWYYNISGLIYFSEFGAKEWCNFENNDHRKDAICRSARVFL